VLGTAGIAAHTQERVLEPAALEVVLEPVLDHCRQAITWAANVDLDAIVEHSLNWERNLRY
jgi:hypothetical protein